MVYFTIPTRLFIVPDPEQPTYNRFVEFAILVFCWKLLRISIAITRFTCNEKFDFRRRKTCTSPGSHPVKRTYFCGSRVVQPDTTRLGSMRSISIFVRNRRTRSSSYRRLKNEISTEIKTQIQYRPGTPFVGAVNQTSPPSPISLRDNATAYTFHNAPPQHGPRSYYLVRGVSFSPLALPSLRLFLGYDSYTRVSPRRSLIRIGRSYLCARTRDDAQCKCRVAGGSAVRGSDVNAGEEGT